MTIGHAGASGEVRGGRRLGLTGTTRRSGSCGRRQGRLGGPDWERLRELASAIKAHTQSRLADYLEEFERNATAAGARVHWARDADEHNAIVHRSSRSEARRGS